MTGPENLLLTADFPYAVEAALSYDLVMFVNGCCGDISSRFTRQSSSFSQAEIYAEEIAAAIEKAVSAPEYEGALETIGMHRYPVTLPVKKVRPVAVETEQLQYYCSRLEDAKSREADPKELRVLASYIEGAEVSVLLSESLQGLSELHVHFTVIRLNTLTIAVIPGELFSTLGRQLKKDGIEVFGYGNGYYMYIADETAYEKQYYEAMSSPFAKGAGEYLISEIKKHLQNQAVD
ncbi:MAG: hypothetical protein ACI4DV_01875 [Lachnospiraceae bacterium]